MNARFAPVFLGSKNKATSASTIEHLYSIATPTALSQCGEEVQP